MAEETQPKACRGQCIDRINDFDVVACEPCGFVHVLPLPTATQLESMYSHDYYTREKPLYLERHREDLAWWNTVYAERYAAFDEHHPDSGRRILDVGSGPGFFLKHGLDRGWQTLGVEPSRQAAEHARSLGLDIVGDFLTPDTAANLGCFDVVHMSEVLEHIPDPAQMLELAWTLLAPQGLLCVLVPNDYNPLQLALREGCDYSPWWAAPPHHINYFNFESLTRLVERTGFDVVQRESTFPMELFLLMGDNYVGNDALGRSCHAKRKAFETHLTAAGRTPLKQALYRKLAELGLGREVYLIARKAP